MLLKEYKELPSSREIYMHKSQADRIAPGEITKRGVDFTEVYSLAKKMLSDSEYAGFDYNCVVWQYGKNQFRFDFSSDFDTVSEPGIDKMVTVNLETGGAVLGNPTQAVWHGREMWVDDDYTGFDIGKAREWRERYKSELSKRPNAKGKIPNPVGGSRASWLNHLIELGLIDQYFEHNHIDDPEAYINSLPPTDGAKKLKKNYERYKSMKTESMIRRAVRRSINEALKVKQEFTSYATDVNGNRGKTAAGFQRYGKRGAFGRGKYNLDIGGGEHDCAHEFLNSEYGAINLVFDPFKRDSDYNARTIAKVEELGGADTITCFNCLNVIKEPEVRDNVILQCAQALKPGGVAYFQFYFQKGKSAGVSNAKKGSWQNHFVSKQYADEIRRHFRNVKIEGQEYIVASDPIESDVQSQWRLSKDDDSEWRTLNLRRDMPQGIDESVRRSIRHFLVEEGLLW